MTVKTKLAFPAITTVHCGDTYHGGMTLREWFAGMALQGIMTNGEPEDVKHNAIVACRNADALIKELTDSTLHTKG